MSSYSKTRKANFSVISAGRFYNIILYVLIYVGYFKLLFPQAGVTFNILQYISIGLGFLFILTSSDNRVFFTQKTFAPIAWLVVCFAILGLNFFRSDNRTYAQSKISAFVITIIYSVIIYIYSKYLSDDETIQEFIGTIINTNTIIILVYIAIHITSLLTLIREGMRGGDQYSNPIWIARLCSDTIILILCGPKAKFTPIQIFRLVMLFGIAFLMGSKGPIFAAIIVILFYYQSRGDLNYRLLMTIFAVIIIGIVAFFIARSNSSFIQNRFSLSSILVSSPGYRVSRYQYTLRNIPSKLWLGFGLGNWPINYWGSVSFSPAWVTSEMKLIDYPHNMILEIAYDGGLVALIPFAISLFSISRCSKYYGKTDYVEAISLVMIANFLYAMFSGGITIGNTGFYYFTALYCGIQNARAVADNQ